jgi:LacI family transcriptional regulator
MINMNVPIVLINGITESEAVGSVGVDVFGGARTGVDHLIEHGRTSIGLVMGDNGLRGTLDRHRGWLQSLQRAGLPEGPIVPVHFSREGGYSAGQRLLSAASAPTAVFVSSDLQAVGVLRAFHEAGVRVPEDIALVSFDGSLESQYTWPSLTVVRQPIPALAQHAVAMLLNRNRQPQQVLMPGELIVRRSCGCTPTGPD